MASGALHDELVRKLLAAYASMGLTVREAALPGWNAPPNHGRHAPDVVACTSDGLYRIGQAKLGNGDIQSPYSREQYQDFANRVMPSDRRVVPFDLLAPKYSVAEVLEVLQSLGLLHLPHVHIWTA